MEHNIIVFGATGDLAQTKIIPALTALGIAPLLYGRKESAVPHYIQGTLEESATLLHDKHITHAYVALPPMHYETVLRQLAQIPSLQGIALEKPFGTSYADAEHLIAVINECQLNDKIYLVDHYVGKPALVELATLSVEKRQELYSPDHIAYIFIDALERKNVEHRGAFYDAVGTIRDVVQNHIMTIIGTLLSSDRHMMLEELMYKLNSLHIGQYEGFKHSLGVDPRSHTETFVALDFVYKQSITISVRVGKALHEDKTEAIITYNDGTERRIIIQSPVNSYEVILDDFIHNTRRFALSLGEVLRAWSITEDVLKARSGMLPNIYPQGANPDTFI